jgi:uncharacterized YccA/Bax inhibitor family protein
MKIRFLFGYLCFLISVALCAIQFVALPKAEALPVQRAIILCIVTVIFLVLGFLSFESPRDRHLTLITALAFLVSFAALVCVAAFALIGPPQMSAAKYGLLLFYALLYGCFGGALSLLVQGRTVSKRV